MVPVTHSMLCSSSTMSTGSKFQTSYSTLNMVAIQEFEENNALTSGSCDWLPVNKNSSTSDVKSLLLFISEIVKLSLATENEKFINIGCYFYRVSSVIMELESSENTSRNTAEILQSLSECICIPEDLSIGMIVPDQEVESIIKQLERVIRQMGEVLKSIKISSKEYFHHAIQSLVKDINSFCFEAVVNREKDLYSINGFESFMDDDWTQTTDSVNFPDLDPYLEPAYKIFFCPLTNKIMNDPVTIETGVTYERAAITDWYNKFENPADIICPQTGRKITSRVLNRNSALVETIKQWEERNEQASIKSAKSALSLASNKTTILEALHTLQNLCRKRQYNVVEIRTIGVIPLLGTILAKEDRDLTFETLELLRQLAENDDDDDEGKEMIARSVDLSEIIQSLSSTVESIRHLALLLLVNLSKSCCLCDKIGSVTGGVLMLITLKYRQPVDAFASEKVDEIFKNLERSPSNIKIMAENGHWQPLLRHFLEGNEEMKMEMASYLGEIFLGHDDDDDVKCSVVETASPGLIQMVFHGNSLARNVAFRALKQISSHHESGKILVKAGAVSNMLHEVFKRTIYNEPMDSKAEAAGILANILESGSVELNDLQVDHKMSLDYIIYNIVKRVGNSTPDELNINFLRILLCLMKFSKTSDIIVSMIKEGNVCANLVELVNNPNEELRVCSIVFSSALSPSLGHMLAERLCKTRGQPHALLEELLETTPPTEKQAILANFLAKLPHDNLALNVTILNMNAIPLILRRIQKSGMRMSKYGSAYLEGLVGILVRFTETLYDHQVLNLAKTSRFTAVFTELLMNTSSDEVQRLSAIGLKNLSSKTVTLSKPAQITEPKFRKLSCLQKCFSFDFEKPQSTQLCPVHKGSCSPQETFCLLEANAVENLLACFDHRNIQVVEAALSAICTLLDERVDLEASVSLLIQENAMQHVLNVVKQHKDESLRQKSFWILEKMLTEGEDNSTSEISQDRFLHATLINVLHHGHGDIRLMAEKILRQFNKMPN